MHTTNIIDITDKRWDCVEKYQSCATRLRHPKRLLAGHITSNSHLEFVFPDGPDQQIVVHTNVHTIANMIRELADKVSEDNGGIHMKNALWTAASEIACLTDMGGPE